MKNSLPSECFQSARLRGIVAVVAVVWSLPLEAQAQTYQTWRGENTQGNLLDANAWWNFPNNSTMVFGQQEFDNNVQTTMTNNNGGSAFSTWRWLFKGGASSARTITGSGLRFFDSGGQDPQVINQSSATHVLNVAVSGDGDSGDPFQIWLDSTGGLTFGSTVNNQGSDIQIQGTNGGAKTVTFSGIVSGSGGMYLNNANATALFDAANTQSGQLTINAGTARLNSAGDTFGATNQAIRIGTSATLDLNNVSTTVGSVAEEGSSDGGSISLGSGTLTVTAAAGSLFQNSISGTGGLTKQGAHTLSLYGTQNFTGTTTVSAGRLSTAVSMSSTSFVIDGGTLATTAANVLSDSAAVTISSGELNLGGNETVSSLAGSGGAVSLGSNTLVAGDSSSTTFAGIISGSGGITKSGSGTLSLAGNNTYSGDTRITAGQLTVDVGGDLGDGETDVFISSGAQLNLNTSVIVDSVSQTGVGNGGTINLGTGATFTLDGADKGSLSQNSISGAGNLSMGASGTTALTLYGTQSYTGSTAVSGGKISTGVSLATSAVNVSGGTFEASAADILSGSAAVTISGTGTFALGGSDTVGSFGITGGALTTTNDATLTAATYTLQGGTVGANLGTGTATASTGTTALNGTLGGNLTVNGGTVNLGSANRLADGASVTVSSSGTLGLGANNDTISSFTLRNTATLGGSGTLTAATYSLQGGTVTAGLGAGAITVTTGTTTLGSAGRLNAASTLAVDSGQLNLGGAETVAGLSGSGGTVNLQAHTLTAAIASGTNTYAGAITGTGGLTKTGIGRLSLSGSSSYNGATAVSAGELNLSGGSIASTAVTVASGASLSGYGSVGTIGGAGAINPGNSPGIMTTPQVDPSGGTDFNLEMTGTSPTYNNAANSVNDVIRITGGTPFSQALASGNGINIYFSGAALFTGSTAVQYQGGFFTDQSASFASSISGATYNYYFANGSGSTTYNGASYYNKTQYESLVLGTNMLITVSTVAQTANFGGGDINGQVMQVQVIPEPSTYALLGLSAAAFGAYRWRRRRRG
jgi:autotransporter-associated beta strand protein